MQALTARGSWGGVGWVGVSAGCIHSTEGVDLEKTRVLRVEKGLHRVLTAMSKGDLGWRGGGGGWTHPHHGHGVAACVSRL